MINFVAKTEVKRHIYIHLMLFRGITVMMAYILHFSNVRFNNTTFNMLMSYVAKVKAQHK